MRRYNVRNDKLEVAIIVTANNSNHAQKKAVSSSKIHSPDNVIDNWRTCYKEDIPQHYALIHAISQH